MLRKIPKVLFLGAGKIAQSIMKGLIKTQPNVHHQILATAPSMRNLEVVNQNLGCQVATLDRLSKDFLEEFEPDFIFLCVKPQSLIVSGQRRLQDPLYRIVQDLPDNVHILSLVAGIRAEQQSKALGVPAPRIIRVMLNTAAEFGLSSVFYHAHHEVNHDIHHKIEDLLNSVGRPVIKLGDENLMNAATGLCGSGIALIYEIIQAFSDVGVKNGIPRAESTQVAAQLARAAGEMVMTKKTHPYQLRDDVSSPAGTTIYGLDKWHELSINQSMGRAVQASIDRAEQLSVVSDEKIRCLNEENKS